MKTKRRFWAALFVFCLVLTMIPMTAFAAERPEAPASCEAEDSEGHTYTCHRVEENEVYVAGTKVGDTGSTEYYVNDGSGGITTGNASAENYNVSYDPASGTITLKGAQLSKTAYTDHRVLYETQEYPRDVSDDAVIMARRDITVKVLGENNIIENKRKEPATYYGLHRHGITVYGDLTITGDGAGTSALTSCSCGENDREWANSIGVYVLEGDLAVENISLTAEGRDSTYFSGGMYVTDGGAVIRNSSVRLTGGKVAPLNSAAVAPGWTGSYGFVTESENKETVIDNSTVEIQAGEGYSSIGVLVSYSDSVLKVQNNAVLKVTASKEAAVSYGISAGMTVSGAYVEAVSEGAKDIPYTYGGETYGGNVYSYGFSGYAADVSDADAKPISCPVKIEKGAVRFMSGPCSGGTQTFSYAYDGAIEDLDYSSDPYAFAKYNQEAAAEGAQEWTETCEAADGNNGMVLQNGYQYFEITHEVTPAGTVKWTGDDQAQRPDSLEINLKYGQNPADSTVAASGGTDAWTFRFDPQPVYNCQITGDYRASDAWEMVDYTVAVSGQPKEYSAEINGSAYSEDGFLITETYIRNEEPEAPSTEPEKPSDPAEPGGQSKDNSGGTSAPQTGDSSDPVLWIALMGVGAAGIGTAVWQIRRRRKAQ